MGRTSFRRFVRNESRARWFVCRFQWVERLWNKKGGRIREREGGGLILDALPYEENLEEETFKWWRSQMEKDAIYIYRSCIAVSLALSRWSAVCLSRRFALEDQIGAHGFAVAYAHRGSHGIPSDVMGSHGITHGLLCGPMWINVDLVMGDHHGITIRGQMDPHRITSVVEVLRHATSGDHRG